ncbi:bifunctional phosphoribosylaminoimidazolecarboxamide formyltransferase/IMP cyclohydrolase [Enhygromyxa salina]|uniref:bifunctional phosphoribosylaminoimidazolecarboxamide formyltransferase/IMP cyclohydrolase n=1 Tax=Enhygromyxa salina TaxID=215803 RepID=UPI000D047AD9|nr:bifunctional phosphoribosylaminoimidazolecarboxamide formyltransferase/IMP cyclohydrolase [Enhygromyxa salina]
MSTSAAPLRRALVSVSDKSNLATLADILIAHKVEVLSTGGTHKALLELGVAVVKVSEFTGAPEILDGRVKTLHPKIHGGILALPTAAHQAELELHGIAAIDLVVVNLYPFMQTIRAPGASFADAIENIDIGGPTMVRAAAKNWGRVAVVVDPSDYAALGEALGQHGGAVPEGLRRSLARKAFAHTASYDAAIADYLARHDDEGQAIDPAAITPGLFVSGEPLAELRYGENPHQSARFFRTDYAAAEQTGLDRALIHQGKALSYNNLLDADAALGLIRDLHAGLPEGGRAAAVFKHLSPCGAAIGTDGEPLADVFVRAREADAESAFGGIVSVNQTVDADLAARLIEGFLEVVIAPGYTPEARALLAKKKRMRVLELPQMFAPVAGPPPLRLRSVAGGVLVQREDLIGVAARDGQVPTKRAPTAAELSSLDLGQRVAKHVRSNAIVLVRDNVTVGIGGGQTSRVEAVRQALSRAGEAAKGAVLASDAFFPFRDSVDAAAQAGVRAIIQPAGSMRDAEVVAACDEHDVAMVATGERHFRH